MWSHGGLKCLSYVIVQWFDTFFLHDRTVVWNVFPTWSHLGLNNDFFTSLTFTKSFRCVQAKKIVSISLSVDSKDIWLPHCGGKILNSAKRPKKKLKNCRTSDAGLRYHHGWVGRGLQPPYKHKYNHCILNTHFTLFILITSDKRTDRRTKPFIVARPRLKAKVENETRPATI